MMSNVVQRTSGLLTTVAALSALTLGAATPTAATAEGVLNVLTWCDIEDAKIIEPFEKANSVKINFKDVDSTAAALAILGQSKPGDWDVLMSDGSDTRRIVAKKLLAPLDPKDYPMGDLFPGVADANLTSVDGKFYMVPLALGYHGLAYNALKVDPKDMNHMAAAWDPKYKGRVGVYDYYIPQVETAALLLGKNPKTLSEADLPAIKDKLIELKRNSSLIGDIPTTQQALAAGTIDVLLGADSAFTAGFATDKPNLTYAIPQKGVVRWQTGLAELAGSKNEALSVKLIQYLLSPETQGKIATSSCFWSVPVNRKAVLAPDEQKIIQWDQQAQHISDSNTYLLLSSDMDKKLQDLWADVLQSN